LAKPSVSPRPSTGPKHGHRRESFWRVVLYLAYVRSAEWQHFALSQPAFRRGEKVRSPGVESGAFLRCPIMPFVNPEYASPATAQMIEYRLGDFEAHAEAPAALSPAFGAGRAATNQKHRMRRRAVPLLFTIR